MFHSTAMVPDYDGARDALARLVGLRVLEYSDQPHPAVGRRGGMTWIGDNSLELGQPTVAGGGAARFVERTGGGLHSVAVQVRDLAATKAALVDLGIPVAAEPDPAFFFSDPRATGGVFFEWGCLEMEEDPRFGAPVPDFTCEPLLDVTHQAWVGAVVEDPIGLSRRLAPALTTEVAFQHPGGPPDRPAAGVPVGADCLLALYPMPGPDDEALWGHPYPKARTHLLALRVEDLKGAAWALAGAGVGVIRSGDHELVVDPRATGGVALAVVDRLLPGDPRR